MLQAVLGASPRLAEPRGELVRTPDELATMVRLHALGWAVRRIGQELGCSHVTVRHAALPSCSPAIALTVTRTPLLLTRRMPIEPS